MEVLKDMVMIVTQVSLMVCMICITIKTFNRK